MESKNDWRLQDHAQFDAGGDAFNDGEPIEANPWREGSVLHESWRKGWIYQHDISPGPGRPLLEDFG